MTNIETNLIIKNKVWVKVEGKHDIATYLMRYEKFLEVKMLRKIEWVT